MGRSSNRTRNPDFQSVKYEFEPRTPYQITFAPLLLDVWCVID